MTSQPDSHDDSLAKTSLSQAFSSDFQAGMSLYLSQITHASTLEPKPSPSVPGSVMCIVHCTCALLSGQPPHSDDGEGLGIWSELFATICYIIWGS